MTPMKCYRFDVHDNNIIALSEEIVLVIDQADRPWQLTADSECSFLFTLMSSFGRSTKSLDYATTEMGAKRVLAKKYGAPLALLPKSHLSYKIIQRNAWRFVSPLGYIKDDFGIVSLEIVHSEHNRRA